MGGLIIKLFLNKVNKLDGILLFTLHNDISGTNAD